MKHIVLIFLFLFPVFLYAQYPTTGNKQRLGWQTTGDGLIWRGVAADTVYKPNNRNYPYFQLDTVNAVLYRYIATQGSWQSVGVDTSLFVRYTDRDYQISLTKGLISGGVVTINADPTKIDISAGTGLLVDDWTDPQNPVTYDVSWNAFTALAVTYLGTSTFSNILITNTGAVLQTEDDPTDVQMRENIYLARLGHTSFTAVQSVVPKYSVAQSPMSQINGLMNFIGLINSGNVISANGANLSINKSAGQLHGKGVNYAVSAKTPNTVSIASATAPTIRRRTQTGVGTSSTSLDVGNYDVAGTITALSGTKYTNQRVFLFTNGNIVVQYGQVQYTTMTLAIAGVETEEFVIFPNLTDAALIGVISVRSTATDLSDPAQAYFGLVSKFGELGFGSGGAGTYNSWTAAADTGTPAVINDGETLTTAGGFGVNTSISGNTITVEADTAQVATQYDLSSYLPILGGRLTGTAGAGFIGFPTQSSIPATPANGFSIFGDNTGRFSWIQTDGYLRTLISPTAIADRGYRFQNKSYTLADSADVAALPTGSGTLNYIPKWTSGTALGNSNMTDNNTVVSILNSKPFALGQWTTAGRPTGVSGYMGYNTTLTGIDWYNGTRWATGMESTFARGTATRIPFFDANGQVTEDIDLNWDANNNRLGIGTASPFAPIEIVRVQNAGTIMNISNTSTGGSAYAGYFATSGGSAGNGAFYKTSVLYNPYKNQRALDLGFYNGTQGGNIALLNDFASGNFNVATGGSSTAQLTLTSGGNFLLGTVTDVSRRLHVSGEARITDLTTDTPTQIVGADADGDLGAISVSTGLSLAAGVLTATGVSSNIYTADGALTGNRTLTGGAFDLRLNTDVTVGDSLRVVTLPDHTDPDSIATVKGGVIGKRKWIMPSANAYDGTSSGYFFDGNKMGFQNSGASFHHLDYSTNSGYWEKGTYGANGSWSGIYGEAASGGDTYTEMYSDDSLAFSALRLDRPNGLYFWSSDGITPTTNFRISREGVVRLDKYATGAKTAAALSKTQSAFVAGFATDGTVTDYRIQRDTFTADADFTISATLLSTCQELFVSAEVSSGHTDTVNVILPLPSSTYANKKIHVFADDDNSTWWVAAKTLLGNGLYLGNPSGTKPAATNYVAVSTSAGFSGFTYTFTCTRRSTGTYHWVLSIQN